MHQNGVALRKILLCFYLNSRRLSRCPGCPDIDPKLAAAGGKSVASWRWKLPGAVAGERERASVDRLKRSMERWVQAGVVLPASISGMGLILQPILFIISTR